MTKQKKQLALHASGEVVEYKKSKDFLGRVEYKIRFKDGSTTGVSEAQFNRDYTVKA